MSEEVVSGQWSVVSVSRRTDRLVDVIPQSRAFSVSNIGPGIRFAFPLTLTTDTDNFLNPVMKTELGA
jgi:hypothetical protein